LAISVAFWKLNQNVVLDSLAKVAAKIMEKGLFPPEGMNILGWYMCPGGKGVKTAESKTIDPAVDSRIGLYGCKR
jgi:hypothetical protein